MTTIQEMDLADGVRMVPARAISNVFQTRQLFERMIAECKATPKLVSQIDDFGSKLVVQRATFETTCRLLLFAVLGNNKDVENMFEYTDHSVWTEAPLGECLGETMDRSHESCFRILQHIWKILEELYSECQSTGKSSKTKGKASFNFLSRRRPSKPISGSVRTDLVQFLRNLQQSNDIFYTLVRQIPTGYNTPLVNHLTENSVRSSSSYSVKDTGYHLKFVQRVSRYLYDILSSVRYFRHQSAHPFRIFLDLNSPEEIQLQQGRCLRFQIAFTSSLFKDPCRLMVDATRTDKSYFCALERLKSSRIPSERGENYDPKGLISRRQSATKRQHRLCVFNCLAERDKSGSSLYSNQLNSEPQDLSSKADLCQFLEESFCNFAKSGERKKNLCLECLRAGEDVESVVFYVRLHGDQNQSSYSLDEYFNKIKNLQIIISVQDRLYIAMIIAKGVHHLHKTPWIPQKWDSKDVRFIDVDRRIPGSPLWKPFLDIKIHSYTTQESAAERAISDKENPLVSLGVVLLELAFSATLHDLQLSEDITKSFSIGGVDLNFTVKCLIETVSRQFGSRYAKVVRSCFRNDIYSPGVYDAGRQSIDSVISEIACELDQCYLAASAI